ncbi:YycC family protein [Paenibacillus albiflavus]|uniref:YycC family protein n=1 Tax=Paenibacillus albiflavus TaxID=2545760 RepID=A0A4V2WNK8_9BACL|nr:YycC family protein [Paenibacillus albiflavus]TCZ75872.1 YycC family protein [Paenibacillus albiflavus]
MGPLQISAETAQLLAKKLGMPLEQIMHMPKHILVQKLTELNQELSHNNPQDKEDQDNTK